MLLPLYSTVTFSIQYSFRPFYYFICAWLCSKALIIHQLIEILLKRANAPIKKERRGLYYPILIHTNYRAHDKLFGTVVGALFGTVVGALFTITILRSAFFLAIPDFMHLMHNKII